MIQVILLNGSMYVQWSTCIFSIQKKWEVQQKWLDMEGGSEHLPDAVYMYYDMVGSLHSFSWIPSFLKWADSQIHRGKVIEQNLKIIKERVRIISWQKNYIPGLLQVNLKQAMEMGARLAKENKLTFGIPCWEHPAELWSHQSLACKLELWAWSTSRETQASEMSRASFKY